MILRYTSSGKRHILYFDTASRTIPGKTRPDLVSDMHHNKLPGSPGSEDPEIDSLCHGAGPRKVFHRPQQSFSSSETISVILSYSPDLVPSRFESHTQRTRR